VSGYGLNNNAFVLNMGRDFVSSAIYERLWESPFFYQVVVGVGWGFFPQDEADQSSHLILRLRMRGCIPLLSPTSSWRDA